MIGFIGTSVTISLKYNKYTSISDLHTFQFTFAHELGFSVSISHLLAKHLNTESNTSNHYEVFLLFLVQSPGNLGTQLNCQNQSQSYVMTDGQLASLSWHIAPIWNLGPDFYFCQTVVGLLMWGTLSNERTGLSFTIAAGPCKRRHSWVQIP
jgi:hypothetical protein